MSILSICLSPGLQRTVSINALKLGEVNRLESILLGVSGKGVNVCRVLQQLGLDSCCLAQGGSNAGTLLSLAQLEGLNLRLIPSPSRLRTCTTIIETTTVSGRRVTELVEPSSPVDDACVDAMSETVRTLLPLANVLVIAGSMAPGFPLGFQSQLASMARDAGVPVFLDMQGAALKAALVARPAVVKINLAEFVATFLADQFKGGEHSGALAEPLIAPDIMAAVAEISRTQASSFVLTRGANSILLARNGELRAFPVVPLAAEEIINPIGCGDAFLAGMLAQLLKAGSIRARESVTLDLLERAMGFATACAQSNARSLRPGFLEDAPVFSGSNGQSSFVDHPA